MTGRWRFFLLALLFAGCQMSLEHYNPDSESEIEDIIQEESVVEVEDPSPDPVTDDPIIPDQVDVPVDDVPVDVPPDLPPDTPVDIPVDDGPQDPPIDDIPAEDVRPDDVPTEDIRPDDVPAEDIRPDDVPAEDVPPDDVPVERLENCGNGLDDDGDGAVDCMDSDCLTAPACAGTCYPKSTLSCGSSITDSNSGAFATDRIETNACSAVTWTGPEVAYSFTLSVRRQVVIRLQGLTADLDLFLLSNSRGRCDGQACIEMSIGIDLADEEISMPLEPGTYYVLVDGYNNAMSSFSLSMGCFLPEICNNSIDDDGDGFVDCSDPDCYSAPACARDCVPAAEVACGSTVSGNTAGAGATDVVQMYSCSTYEETGPEFAYSFTALYPGTATFTISSLSSAYLDLFVLQSDAGRCNPLSCIGASLSDDPTDTVSITTVSGHTYYVVIDGYAETSGTYTLSVSCM